jgi:cysteine desulfurase / selenocysteine lyase
MPTTSATGDDVGLPAWLPDEAMMNRLAGEFFSALPGGTAALPGAAGGAGVPTVGSPVPAGTGLPFPPVAAPVPEPVSGSYYFLSGTPAYTPAAPALPGFGEVMQPSLAAPPALPLPRSGFYFLSDGPATVPPLPLDPHPAFDVHAVRRDFPILSELVNGRPLIWLDNAATTQKPQAVLDRLASFYTHENSNIHRAAHELATRATDAYESARDTVARFLGAGSAKEIVFVRGATEAINLVAQAWGRRHVREGDEIIISHLEHHANIVPWQMLAKETGAVIKVIPVDDAGQLLLEDYTALLSDRTKLIAVTHVSNALGTVTPVKQIVELGHRAGATVLIDGAQSVPHTTINLQEMAPDFFVFSGHKIFGPTGIGVLYGREEVLADTPPWQGGGNMITDVTLERSIYQPPPGRFEAGTVNIADAAGLATALDYVERIGMPTIAAYEHSLLEHATASLREIPGLRLVGTAAEKASVVSFVLAGYTPEEVGSALNEEGIAVRGGHHCAQPILRRLGLEATVRPSLALYNTRDEIDTLVAAVHRLAQRSGHPT